MNRETQYYFSHDANAKDDPKSIMLIDQLGCEGYGIFWILIETLRSSSDYKCSLKIIPGLAKRYGTSVEKMTAVIKGYDLFQVENDEFFYSESLNRRMEEYQAKILKKSIAGHKGNLVRWHKNTTEIAEVSHCDNNAIPLRSELIAIKEKKRKENKIYNIACANPNLENVLNFLKIEFSEEIAKREGTSFFNHYEAQGWTTSGHNPQPITNWQAKARQWVNNSKNFKNGNEKHGSLKDKELNDYNWYLTKINKDGYKDSDIETVKKDGQTYFRFKEA